MTPRIVIQCCNVSLCLNGKRDLSSLSLPITYQQKNRVCFLANAFISLHLNKFQTKSTRVFCQVSSPRVSRKQNEPPQHWQGPNHRIKGACNSAPQIMSWIPILFVDSKTGHKGKKWSWVFVGPSNYIKLYC